MFLDFTAQCSEHETSISVAQCLSSHQIRHDRLEERSFRRIECDSLMYALYSAFVIRDRGSHLPNRVAGDSGFEYLYEE